ncbi:EpsG family protein [Streptococcus pneumoniae]|uniref:Wzy n=1 Tax=Streptococcus pneumoniae TaxID=1313 RepID=Q4K0T2_STREE|nr:EpsG family protein [Streptococcus pneumoniae]AFN40464.1 Wzy [Streptococcus pneumoniae]AFN40480.1 Wzy [Streptococcus pneumoniae]MBW7501795.1 EpsG family protein [Streptococcus pneumoniae]MBW8156879.1 EpsG family protein [Streptococcus pneumoniae]MDG7261834.1 EpsG family protein [Streptococcus pneumoniae]
MIYIGTMLLSMLIITFIKYFRISKKWKEAVYFWGFIPLILIGALRAYVGIDYTTYSLDQIPAVLAGSQTVKFELLDKLVVYIGYYLANQQHYFYIFAIFHIILMWFLYKYIVQQSSNVMLSVFFLLTTVFFTFSLSGIRQSIATAIVFYALKYIKQKKSLHYIIYLGIACLFHSSAVIYILFLVLGKININRFVGFALPMIASLFSFSGSEFVSRIILHLNFYSEYVGSRYYTGAYDKQHQLFTIVMCLSVFLLYYIVPKKEWVNLKLYLNINFVLLLVAIIMPILPTPSRTIYMFVLVHVILIPKLISVIKDYRSKVIITMFFVLGYFIFFSITVLQRNAYETLPYHTIFEYLW